MDLKVDLHPEFYGYCYENLVYHLALSNQPERIYSLIENPKWFSEKMKLDYSYSSFLSDIDVSLGLSEEALRTSIYNNDIENILGNLIVYVPHMQFKLDLLTVFNRIPIELFGSLVKVGRISYAISLAEMSNNPEALINVAKALNDIGKYDEAYKIVKGVKDNLDLIGGNFDRLFTQISTIPRHENQTSSRSKRFQDIVVSLSSLIINRLDIPNASLKSLVILGEYERVINKIEAMEETTEITDGLQYIIEGLIDFGNSDLGIRIAKKFKSKKVQFEFLVLFSILLEGRTTEIKLLSIHDARMLCEEYTDQTSKAKALLTIAERYIAVDHKDQARDLINKTALIKSEIVDRYDRGVICCLIANNLLLLDDEVEAKRYIEEAGIISRDMQTIESATEYDERAWNLKLMEKYLPVLAKAGQMNILRNQYRSSLILAQEIGENIGVDAQPPLIASLALDNPSLARKIAADIVDPVTLQRGLHRAVRNLLKIKDIERAYTIIVNDYLFDSIKQNKDLVSDTYYDLAVSAELLLNQNDYRRAKNIVDLTNNLLYKFENTLDLLSGIAAGLARAGQLDDAREAVDLAVNYQIDLPSSTPGLSKYKGFIHDIKHSSSPKQILWLADNLLRIASEKKEDFTESESGSTIREEWVNILTESAHTYAYAGEYEKAISVIDIFGDEYGRGRRYYWAFGKIVSAIRSNYSEKLDKEYKKINDIKVSIKGCLEADLDLIEDDPIVLDKITDEVVTLSRLGELKPAIDYAWRINNPQYRASALATITYEYVCQREFRFKHGSPNDQLIRSSAIEAIKFSDIPEQLLKAIVTIGQLGDIEYAEKELFKFLHGSDIDSVIKTFDNRQIIYSDAWMLMRALSEIATLGSINISKILASLVLEGHPKYIGELGPALGNIPAYINIYWIRIKKISLLLYDYFNEKW